MHITQDKPSQLCKQVFSRGPSTLTICGIYFQQCYLYICQLWPHCKPLREGLHPKTLLPWDTSVGQQHFPLITRCSGCLESCRETWASKSCITSHLFHIEEGTGYIFVFSEQLRKAMSGGLFVISPFYCFLRLGFLYITNYAKPARQCTEWPWSSFVCSFAQISRRKMPHIDLEQDGTQPCVPALCLPNHLTNLKLG